MAYTPYGSLALPTAPKPNPYGDFKPPNPADIANDPAYQFRLAQGEKGLQRSAAAHGTLLTGGLLKSLANYDQGLASEEASKQFDRALAAYNTNRSTNDQNFGQAHTAFGDEFSLAGANNAANMDMLRFNAAKDAAANAANAAAGVYPAPSGSLASFTGSLAPPIGTVENQVRGQQLAAKIPSFMPMALGGRMPSRASFSAR